MDSSTYFNWHSGFYEHYILAGKNNSNLESRPWNMRDKRPIKVYIRVRPFNDDEKERIEASALEVFKEDSRIKVLDERHSLETSYVFDGVFGEEDDNQKVYNVAAKPLINKLFNGINCALLTYGQTGTGKTHTVLAEGSVTNFAIDQLFERITNDTVHTYKVNCSFVQVYQDKVYDLLNPDSNDELCVREHPRKGIYVANLSHHRVDSVHMALELLNKGRKELVIAETKMVRQSSRSHAIFQLSIERRLNPMSSHKEHVKQKSLSNESLESRHSDANNKSESEENGMHYTTLEEDIILKGKFDICDLAGSERLGKTMAEGVRLSEAKHINSSLLELGNVIYALSEGTRRHIPFRNSTLTRLLQECLGPQCRTSFIVCVAPTASEAYETRCSLNFGTRARNITNKERLILNVEVDYKILARRLSRRIEHLEKELGKSFDPNNFLSSNPTPSTLATVQTQTDGCLKEEDVHEESQINKLIKFPQLEIITISEIMTSFLISFKTSTEGDRTHYVSSAITDLFNELLSIVAQQHKVYTLHEDHWAEADIQQLLNDSMDDIDLLKQAIDNEAKDLRLSDTLLKQTEFICNQFDERCTVMEQDMNYCVDKFQDIVAFRNDSSLHRKMKQLIEFLNNNHDGDISNLVNKISLGLDVEFMSWLVCAQMALRFIAALLEVSINTNALDTRPFDKTEADNEGVLNETFDSITTINDDSTLEELDESYASFTNYGMGLTNDYLYAKSSTPKRGHCLPLWIQNQLFNTSRGHSGIHSRDSFYNKSHGYRCRYGDSSFRYLNDLDLSDIDSIDGYLDDTEITHEEQLRHMRSLDCNVMKLEEKCELLEDKNSKLRKTLNVIMKENKELNEKLRIGDMEKSKLAREAHELGHKFQMLIAVKRAVESNLNEVSDEKITIEKEMKRCNSELKKCEIEISGFRRQVSIRDGEIESLRQQIAEMKTEIAASKADGEILGKQIEETQEKLKLIEQESEEMTNAHETLIMKLKELCKMLEKAGEGMTEECRQKMRRSSFDEETTFETELFVAIENNIRIEGILNDVKDQINEMVGANKGCSNDKAEKRKRDQLKIVDQQNLGKTMKRKGGQSNRRKETRTSTMKSVKPLRYNHKSFVCDKENDGVAPRGAKIKELMNEKLKIEMDNKELVQRNEKIEEELKTAKTQIEMLVKECGALDHQLLNMKTHINDNVEDKLRLETKDISGSNDSSLFLRTKELNELEETQEELRKSLEISQDKTRDLESELTLSKEKHAVSKRHVKELEKKYEATKKQLHHYESQSYNQNMENTRLRDHVIQLSQELSREQQKVEDVSNKLSAVKERNAMHIKRLEDEMMKFVKKLDRYREREKERRQQLKRLETSAKDSSEADSGLVPDHIDEIIDLT